MLTELRGKAGNLCDPAKQGKLRCPLLVRSSSEDVITGHLVQALRILNSRWWLSDFLNEALGADRFRRQFYRRLRIEPWVNQPRYPRALLPWDEGSTQVDCEITWNNPHTTVFIEAKYQADLSATTVNANGSGKYPADQLIRNVRVGLYRAGYFEGNSLFKLKPRDFVVILLCPTEKHRLVKKYRDNNQLLAAIPHSDKLLSLPQWPFVGQITYRQIILIFSRQRRWFSRPERVVIDGLTEYLDFKRGNMKDVFTMPQQAPFKWNNGDQPGK